MPLIKKFKEIIIVQSYHLKESQARGVLQDNMANSYNGEDFENGLLHLSKSVFPTDNFLYQDGQYLDKNTVNAYLNPKYSKDEIDNMSESEKESKKLLKI